MKMFSSKRKMRNSPLLSYSTLSYAKFKVMVGLLWFFVWLSGLVVIIVFLSTTQQQRQYQQQHLYSNSQYGALPSITIFAAPCPLSSSLDVVGARQELAVRSWLAASPNVDVVLFGNHPSILTFAATFGSQVSVESAIDFTFQGTPFFHSMVARAQASSSDISVLIDHETILLPNFFITLHHVQKLNNDWFLASISPSISHFPFRLDDTGRQWLHEDGEQIEVEKVQEFLVQKRHCKNCGERLLIAWNTGDVPLHTGVLPPFFYGKCSHNEWLVNEVMSSKFRFVIDASEVISSFYLERLGHWSNQLPETFDSGDVSEKVWECRSNSHLAALYGSVYVRPIKDPNDPVELINCLGRYFLTNPAENTVYSLEGLDGHASHSLKLVSGREQERLGMLTRFMRLRREKNWITCVEDFNPLGRESNCSVMELCQVDFKTSMPLPFTFSLESILQTIADKDKSVVLAVAGDNYRDMLMSWVCRLRHLAVTNFIVCALDSEIYQFSVFQGLPVFKDPLAPSNISFNDCHFGTECFQRVTKVKSRLVLQILKLGYNVLLSDVDVYWFDNPLPFLQSFGPAILVAQSDEYNETGPINLPRRLNSGFYFARSDLATIAAMQKVVKHASTSGLSEQPSFYDVLCGEGGVNRVGDDRCLEPTTNLIVHFLDRNLFPNGAFKGLWEKDDVRSACMKTGCLILHNNWISGRKRKLERQVLSGLWEYDASSRLCLQSWLRNKSMNYF